MQNCFRFSRRPGSATRLSICVGALLLGGWAHSEECKIGNEVVNPSNGGTTRGKTGMMRCVDKDTAAVLREQEWRDGRVVGVQRYYERGKLVQEFSVNERGNKHGLAREFAPSGVVVSESTYDNGVTVGLSRTYYASGQLNRVGFYGKSGRELAYVSFNSAGKLAALHCADEPLLGPTADDKRYCGFDGASSVELFDEQQRVRSKLSYERARLVRSESLSASGVTQSLMQVQANRSIEQFFSPAGVKQREEHFLLLDKGRQRELEQRFSDSGKLTDERRWSGGLLQSERRYYLNGQMRHQYLYGGPEQQRVRDETTYYDSGKLAREGRYRLTSESRYVPVGVHRTLAEDGKIRGETSYDDKGRRTRERSWDEFGKLTQDDAVFDDGSRKAFSK